MPLLKGNEDKVELALKIPGQGQLLPEQIGTTYYWKGHFTTYQNFLCYIGMELMSVHKLVFSILRIIILL